LAAILPADVVGYPLFVLATTMILVRRIGRTL
jgi:hypothetical protein